MTTELKDKWVESHELAYLRALDMLADRNPRLAESFVSAMDESVLETGSAHLAAKYTERFLEANARFEFDDDGSFEATVDVEGGVKYLSGVGVQRASNEAEATCKALNYQVIRAYDALRPEDALQTIGVVWNMAEKTCELAAARSRLLLGKLPKLPSAAVPLWFENAVLEWDADDNAMLNPASLNAARKIVGCAAAEFPSLQAQLTVGMLGRVTLDWYIENVRCSWMIDPTDLPFPSTRIYEARRLPRDKMQTRIIHDMHSALTALREIANESNGN